ncbi:hypothetical protein [Xanthobacter sp. ZOL 2024]
MAQAAHTSTTPRRRPEDAATFTLMLLKAAILGPDHGAAPVQTEPKRPILAGGAARKVREIA